VTRQRALFQIAAVPISRYRDSRQRDIVSFITGSVSHAGAGG
jgi:hypothetical protein